MSRENAEKVRASIDAFNRRDLAGLTESSISVCSSVSKSASPLSSARIELDETRLPGAASTAAATALAPFLPLGRVVGGVQAHTGRLDRRGLTALRTLMRRLGPDWAFLTTDVTAGRRGNQERLTYAFDRRTLRPSGLVGELKRAIWAPRSAAGSTC